MTAATATLDLGESVGLPTDDPMPAADDTEDATAQYTIDDLAAASKVPSRTIRFYQSAGALPRPTLRGRVAYYSEAHLERLRLVADLQDRGLQIKAICDLLSRIDRGELDLENWLGLEQQLGASWVDDSPKTVDEDQLFATAGAKRPGLIADLLRLGLARRQGDAFVIDSPGLLRIAVRLESAGFDLQTAVGANEILGKHAAKAARELASYVLKHAGDQAEAIAELRRAGPEALRLLFGQQMEQVLRQRVNSGKAIPRRKPKPKRR